MEEADVLGDRIAIMASGKVIFRVGKERQTDHHGGGGRSRGQDCNYGYWQVEYIEKGI